MVVISTNNGENQLQGFYIVGITKHQGRTQIGGGRGVLTPSLLENLGGGVHYNPPPPYPPLVTNQTKMPYPKSLKNSNKTKLGLKESKNNFQDIFPLEKFWVISTPSS